MGWRKTTLTILNGAATSEELDLTEFKARRVKNLQITGPAALTNTVTVHTAEAPGGTYRALAAGGVDYTIPAVKNIELKSITAGALKLIAGGNEAADRVFLITGAAVQ